MNIRDLLKEESVILNNHCHSKEEALDTLINRHDECGHLNNKEQYKKAILAREELSSTGVGNMIAIPHAQDDSVNCPSLVAMVDRDGVDFQSLDQQPAKIFFMIAVPKDGGTQHLEILAKLCQILMDEKIVQQLLKSGTPLQFIDILTSQMKEEVIEEEIKKETFDILAVTACPTGIAHTYMAAKSLEETAKEMNISIKVETNGASGIKNKLTSQEIEDANCIIIAADKKVEMDRFNGKHLIQVPVAKGIHEAKELLEKAIQEDAPIYEGQNNQVEVNEEQGVRKFYKHLMNGISNAIPLLMIYGIFIAILYTPLIKVISPINFDSISLVQIISSTSHVLLQMIPVIVAAFIADSISDRPGFVVAFIGSLIAVMFGGSIIECIIIGFIGASIVKGLQKVFSYLPEVLNSIVPNLLLPIIGTIIVGTIVILAMEYRVDYISLISEFDTQIILIILGFVLGLMMSIDMGGPINKTAYTIGIIGIFVQRFDLMSAVMIGGMIPPIVLWLTMIIYPSLFDEDQRKGKWRCLIKGLCFVSEEAIPYMSKDRRGVHVPCIIASGVAGALSVYFHCGQMFPHGGIIVLPLIINPISFVISMGVSIVVGTILIIFLKKTSQA